MGGGIDKCGSVAPLPLHGEHPLRPASPRLSSVVVKLRQSGHRDSLQAGGCKGQQVSLVHAQAAHAGNLLQKRVEC